MHYHEDTDMFVSSLKSAECLISILRGSVGAYMLVACCVACQLCLTRSLTAQDPLCEVSGKGPLTPREV